MNDDRDDRAVRRARWTAHQVRRRRADSVQADTFRIRVDDDAEVPRLVLAGDVDIGALPRVRAALRSVLAAAPEAVDVDFSEVELLETTAAAVLARTQAAASEQGVSLRMTGARGVPARLLKLAGARGVGIESE
ncbi:STAS domain-containing protein [Baekduia soli]|nr:STAS domain-containing protein [Baekduia soli]